VVDHESLSAPSAEALLIEAFAPERRHLLDYGCGPGGHRPFIESLGYQWTGVDYLEGAAPAVQPALAQKSEIVFYDGRKLPFASASFDIAYSMLVFQCVQHIDEAYAEIARVLRPGGLVIGQVGSLEAMTDYVAFNHTPFGLKAAARNAGMRLTRLYPKHDVFSFLCRQLYIVLTRDADTPFTPMLDPGGFFFSALEARGRALGLSVRDINLLKLQFSAHMCFVLEKPQ
jgi:SAM-dependent methyltransferase